MKLQHRMKFFKSTKNKHVYNSYDTEPKDVVVPSVYVNRNKLPLHNPETITITVEFDED